MTGENKILYNNDNNILRKHKIRKILKTGIIQLSKNEGNLLKVCGKLGADCDYFNMN